MRNHFEMKYYDTYYYANIVHNVIMNAYKYLGGLEEFFGDQNYKIFLQPFQKKSALHKFIYHIIRVINLEDINDVMLDKVVEKLKSAEDVKLPFNYACDQYDIPYIKFNEWFIQNKKELDSFNEDDIIEYIDEYNFGEIDLLYEKISEEVFFVLFLNRVFLTAFNKFLSGYIEYLEDDELEDEDIKYFTKKCKIRRTHIPTWVRKAVFYRDRGICINCNRDLTGLIVINNVKHFDHIIPLANGGINDVTNIQLLCEECNLSKSNKIIYTSNRYEKWY